MLVTYVVQIQSLGAPETNWRTFFIFNPAKKRALVNAQIAKTNQMIRSVVFLFVCLFVFLF